MKMRLALALLLVAAPAFAQQNVEDAKRHFKQGVALYNDGNYNAALAEFEAANKLRPSPAVLYNIGLTQKALFRYNDAIDSLNEYITKEQKLTAERRAEVKQLINEMKALLAEVTLNVIPDGAQILLDGRTIGQAPMKPYGIAAGNHVIDANAEGYNPMRRELMVSAGVPMTVNIKLEPIPRSGKVKITASQPLAQVKIDDKVVGMAPLTVDLPLGGHQLEVTAKGYAPFRSELVVAGGQERVFNAVLELPPTGKDRFYHKWYFWTPIAVGVVAIALGVGLGVGLKPPDPLVGTLDPGAQPVN